MLKQRDNVLRNIYTDFEVYMYRMTPPKSFRPFKQVAPTPSNFSDHQSKAQAAFLLLNLLAHSTYTKKLRKLSPASSQKK